MALNDDVTCQVYEVATANVSSECLVIAITLSKLCISRPDMHWKVPAGCFEPIVNRNDSDGSGFRTVKLVEHVIAQHRQRPGKDAVDLLHCSEQSWLA
jgi:hypothetical protein